MGNTQSNAAGQVVSEAGGRISDEDMTETSPGQRLLRPSSPVAITNSRQRSSIYGSIRQRVSSRLSMQPSELDVPTSRVSQEMDMDHDDSPLVHDGIQATQEDTSLTASTQAISRSLSTVSRLGSRLMPEAVRNTLWNSGEETAQEGQALRNGVSARQRPVAVQRQTIPQGRFSLVSSIRRRIGERGDSRLDVRRQTIRGPFPIGATHELLRQDNSFDFERSLMSPTPLRITSSARRPPRLRRMRHSLAAPFASLLQRSTSRTSQGNSERNASSQPPRVTFADDSDRLLPPLSNMDHRIEIDEPPHELDAVEPETRNILATSPITSGMSTIRRFPHSLRSRPTRLIRRAEYPPLSQVLQLAAAAIAAQLSGHTTPTASTGRPFGGDVLDGSIQDFVQTLQEAASAQAGETLDVNTSEGDLPPVNFMRVFQFPNDEQGSPVTFEGHTRSVDTTEIDDTTNQGDNDRSVTLVLVGVRSMPNGPESGDREHAHIGASLDNLLSLPFLPSSNGLGSSSGALFRRPDLRTRTHARRRSMTNFSFPAQYESQRHQRTRQSTTRLSSDPMLNSSDMATPLSESPPGPHPPPSTPADLRSGAATPIRRPSSASAVHNALPDLEEDQVEASVISPLESAYNVARQRRRSDSEFARRPELSSGAARRNGVVEPDNAPSSLGRSWLIYVVGTNVSPDHPAFTMPSLFTDNPSYEDMQMLSTLLGPVKPPVATQEDVETAGGVYQLCFRDGRLGLEAVADGGTSPDISIGERCLICLADYEEAEQVRLLSKCQHVYHRECIDAVSAKSLLARNAANISLVVDNRTQ